MGIQRRRWVPPRAGGRALRTPGLWL